MELPARTEARSIGAKARRSPLGDWLLRRRRERERLRRVAARAAKALKSVGKLPSARLLFDDSGRPITPRPVESYLTPASQLPREIAALWSAANAAIRLGCRQQARISRLIAARAAELRRAKHAWHAGRARSLG